MFMGDKDLSPTSRKQLDGFDNVYFTDLSNTFLNQIVGIEGWAIKPYAVLASRFEEIILIDADVVFLRNPEILFEEAGYRETGTFFFKDRTLNLNQGHYEGLSWLKSWMIDPLPMTKATRFWLGKTEHEMDSSTVVIHKTKTLLGLLAVCKFNEYHTRYDVVYRKVLGDKETFWMGFDMARQPYYLNPQPSIFIGELDLSDEIEKKLCGHVGHLGQDGGILYWNGHLIKNKSIGVYAIQLLRFEAYAVDEGRDRKWSNDLSCLNINSVHYHRFIQEDQNIIDKLMEIENENHYVVDPIKTRDKIRNKNKNGNNK